jgi:DNA polymerase-1
MPVQVSNWNSPAQAKKYFTSMGIPVTSLDDLTDDFVKKYNDDTLNKFVEMRKLSTNSSKYGKNFLYDKEGRYLVDPDGRIRADFFQILNTGRFSCSRPPLHGLPREGEQRGAIVARKGCVFVAGDFKGQELGIMAAASGERLWIDALLRGDDPLSLMASMIFKDWAQTTEKGCVFPKKCKCKQHKVYRQDAKTITYGIAYGAYAKSISEKINRTVNDTQKLLYKFSVAAPKLHRWLNKNAKDSILTRTSYSADIYRRRRTIRDPQEWMVRNVGYNNPVQSSGANMMKLSMISLNKKWKQVMPWHDDLILEVKKSEAKKAIKELKAVMEKAADYCTGIPGLIKVDPRITKSLQKDD